MSEIMATHGTVRAYKDISTGYDKVEVCTNCGHEVQTPHVSGECPKRTPAPQKNQTADDAWLLHLYKCAQG